MGGEVADEEEQSPILGSFSSSSSSSEYHDQSYELVKRKGTTSTAVAHIITGVIGAGVLSLSWSVAQLGWIAGPLSIMVFASVTFVSTKLLSDCYRHPDPEFGHARCPSYAEAVKVYLDIELAANYKNFMAVQQSLELASSGSCNSDDDGQLRTGTLFSCVAHIITAVIGAGVLSLAWSTSQLGWIGGPVALLCFAIITYVSSFLLSDCYRSPDPITGKRNHSYIEAVRVNLGKTQAWVCGLLQYLNMYGTGIAYVITPATSMRAIRRSNCYHKKGHQAACSYGDSLYMLLFGVLQILVSQIPDFHNIEWLSVMAAIMSFAYAFIGFGLGFAKVIENGEIHGSITGVPASSVANKMWLSFQALGDIAFAYPYSMILLEIQDTLKSPPAENKTMKKASMIAIFVTTFFYLCCGCFGYAAFGNNTPGNVLTGFGFYEPYWLIDFANACIVLHLVGGYQIYCQPVFAVVEKWFGRKFPESGFVNNFYKIKLPFLPPLQLNPLRLCFRNAYVVSTTAIAMLFPYFNQVLGVLGALNFWPLAIYFPVEMYFKQKIISPWTRKWIVLRTFSFVCLLVTVVGLIGSLEGLISAKSS